MLAPMGRLRSPHRRVSWEKMLGKGFMRNLAHKRFHIMRCVTATVGATLAVARNVKRAGASPAPTITILHEASGGKRDSDSAADDY